VLTILKPPLQIGVSNFQAEHSDVALMNPSDGSFEGISSVAKDMLQHVWREVDYEYDVCRATDGAHCEEFHAKQLFHLCVK
jgi:hypothetical protein